MDRFRVTARRFVYFQARASKLGPSYLDCNERQSSCTRRAAQPYFGCPNCEFTIQYKHFLDDLEKDLDKMKKGTVKGAKRWPIPMLIRTVVDVGSIAGSQKGINPDWPVTLSMLISVYRGEENKKRAIDDFNMMQSVRGPSTPTVQDVGDFD